MTPRVEAPAWLHAAVVGLTLAFALVAGILADPFAGLAVGALAAAFLWRPFLPVLALAALAGAASFVNNEGGRLTRDLTIVAVAAAYALVCIGVARACGRWRAPGGALSLALVVFLAWTAFSAVRGVLAGHPLKDLGLEVVALSMMGFAWLAGGLRLEPGDLRVAKVVLLVVGVAHVGLGVWSYALHHVRTGGIWFTPWPGMLAVLALAHALHAEQRRERWAWTLLLGLFLLHQTISFSRGYWLGLLVALPCATLAFAGRGPGLRARWRRIGAVALLSFSLAVGTTFAAALVFGWTDLPEMIGTRLGSSFGTRNSSVTASNVARLLEYAAAFRRIQEAPVLGHGMGLELRIRNPLFRVTTRQWYVHHTYLWIWLKQGMIGLALLLVLLWHAWRLGARGARAPDPVHAAWGLTAAGATIYLAVVNLTTFHLAQVNATTLQSLFWGFTLALSGPVHWRLVWRVRPAPLARLEPAIG